MANSVNTNVGALIAVRNLNATNDALAKTQNRVSTGLKVTGAKDDASSFAIAQGIRADLKAYQAVDQALAAGKGIGDVAIAGATQISNLLTDLKKKAIEGANSGNTASQQSILAADFAALKAQFQTFVSNATYNGKNLLATGSTDATVVSTISGGTLTITSQSAVGNLTFGDLASASNASLALIDVNAAITAVGTALGKLGSDVNALKFQQDFNKQVSDAVTEGLGSIVDADLSEESAKLQALQVKQQLGVQALSIANSSPQILLSLFQG